MSRLQVLHVLARAAEHRGFVSTCQGLVGRRPARQAMIRDLLQPGRHLPHKVGRVEEKIAVALLHLLLLLLFQS